MSQISFSLGYCFFFFFFFFFRGIRFTQMAPPPAGGRAAGGPPPPAPPPLLPASLKYPSDAPSLGAALAAASIALTAAAPPALATLRPAAALVPPARTPYTLSDAITAVTSKLEDKRKRDARREKAGKAAVQAAARRSREAALPDDPESSTFPGAVPESEPNKSAFWTSVEVRARMDEEGGAGN